MSQENEKKIVALEAIKLVKDNMIVGLGSGSTSAFMIEALGERVKEGLKLKAVPSSEKTAQLARKAKIPLLSLEDVDQMDINIDGADEFDPQLRLIKGGGGAHLREKILAHNAKYNVIIADFSKKVERLGAFKLPVETIPFATPSIQRELEQNKLKPQLRQKDGKNYETDQKNYILDLDIKDYNADWTQLNEMLKNIPGIVETGLFLTSTDLIIYAEKDKIRKIEREK